MPRPAALFAFALLALSCGPAIRRDLGGVMQSAITFDDMCHLQEYFDQRLESHARPLRVVNEQSTETTREERDEHGVMRPVVMGEGTYVLATRTDRVRFRRLLREEYRRLPEMTLTRPEQTVRVKVAWWQAGGIRRIRAGEDVELATGDESWTLPPHPCVGEFLFGEPAYVMRRCFQEAQRARSAGQIPGPCSVGPVEAPPADADAAAPADASAPAADAPAG
jgi:hypothetical protein